MRSGANFASIAVRMRLSIKIFVVTLIAAGGVLGQVPARQAQREPRAPGQSPASQPPPQTITPQTYPTSRFKPASCGLVAVWLLSWPRRGRRRNWAGPYSLRLVTQDTRGDKIGPLLRHGPPATGHAILQSERHGSERDCRFHPRTRRPSLKRWAEAAAPWTPRTWQPEMPPPAVAISTERAAVPRAIPPTGDLAGIASRYQGLAAAAADALSERAGLLRRARKSPFACLRARRVIAPLAGEDEFTITVLDPPGARQSIRKERVKFKIDDPMSAHFDQLGKYTDDDMHNVFAYLETLK